MSAKKSQKSSQQSNVSKIQRYGFDTLRGVLEESLEGIRKLPSDAKNCNAISNLAGKWISSVAVQDRLINRDGGTRQMKQLAEGK